MKTLLRSGLAALAGLMLISTASAGSPVMRMMVRDANGKARVAYVRVSDKRILYPRVVQQITQPGGKVAYREALSSAYQARFYSGYAGYGVCRPGHGYGACGGPGRPGYSKGAQYPDYYRPLGNYGVDAILNRRNRSRSSNGARYPDYYRPLGNYGVDAILNQGNCNRSYNPGYGQQGGSYQSPMGRPQLGGLPLPR